jgi:hypothetical protein
MHTKSYYRSKIRLIFPKIEVVLSVLPIKHCPYYFRTSSQFPLFALSTWCKAKENLLFSDSRWLHTSVFRSAILWEWLICIPSLRNAPQK